MYVMQDFRQIIIHNPLFCTFLLIAWISPHLISVNACRLRSHLTMHNEYSIVSLDLSPLGNRMGLLVLLLVSSLPKFNSVQFYW